MLTHFVSKTSHHGGLDLWLKLLLLSEAKDDSLSKLITIMISESRKLDQVTDLVRYQLPHQSDERFTQVIHYLCLLILIIKMIY